MDTGQWLVDRMPSNPKKWHLLAHRRGLCMTLIYILLIGATQFMFFVSCPCIYNNLPFHFRFEVPLRPELWSSVFSPPWVPWSVFNSCPWGYPYSWVQMWARWSIYFCSFSGIMTWKLSLHVWVQVRLADEINVCMEFNLSFLYVCSYPLIYSITRPLLLLYL